MGRDAGWIALKAGIAGGAHVILIPEIPFTIENICNFVRERESYGKRFTIVVIAEGVKLPLSFKENRRVGSVGNLIGSAIAASANKEVRVSVLGHLQRGGSPTPFDRILAARLWRGGGRPGRRGPVRQDGVPAQRAHRGCGHRRGDWPAENGRS
jgi:ATP-dependent phosphofructokinase / diphosphate-dependent phosphofructokinase